MKTKPAKRPHDESPDAVIAAGAMRDTGSLRQAEQKFRGFFESAPDAFVIVNREGSIEHVNSQTEKLFGYARAELLGQKIEILMPTRYRDGHAGHRDRFIAESKVRPMDAGLELCGRRKDGTEFQAEISLSPLQTEEGAFVMSAIRDISARRRAESQIRTLNAELEQRAAQLEAAIKELESFSYSVSHDLRSPLRAIDGFSRRLVDAYRDRLDATAIHYVDRIRAGTQIMAQLIDDLLGLSQVSRTELTIQPVSLSVLAQCIANELGWSEPGRSVAWSIAGDATAAGDERLLEIALRNLLGNAWKFTSKRGHARIEFGVNQQDGETVFFVRDNGAGFDMAYADKLFAPFQRLHSAAEFPGTGIGLATVRRIIERHGGRVWAQAAVDQGATFYFTAGKGAEHGVETDIAG